MAYLQRLPDGFNFWVYKKITTIGSQSGNDIIIESENVLSSHAQLILDGNQFVLSAADNKFLPLVNGKKIKKAVLNNEDTVTIGNQLLKFYLLLAPSILRDLTERKNFDELSAYQKLIEFSQNVPLRKDINELLEYLLDAVISLTLAERGFIILFREEIPVIFVAKNFEQQHIPNSLNEISDSIIKHVLAEKKPVIVSDALNDAKFASSHSVMRLKLSSVLCVPLVFAGELLGIIYLGNNSAINLFDNKTLELTTLFAASASILIANSDTINELIQKNQSLSRLLQKQLFGEIMGSSQPMLDIFRTIEKVSPTDVPVLISGETGTGKELVARELHYRSSRANYPFQVINCGAIPENLMESELFGYVKGAFTGAIHNQAGKFQAANRGTLFLDEIGELPLALQVKLLRALQEKSVTRIGSNQDEKIDIRILAATNRNLKSEVSAGRFREDLYYRLNVINIALPPLKKRGEDIILLAKYFLNKYSKEYQKTVVGFSPTGIEALQRYGWPGNIRELENKIKKAVVLAEKDRIGARDLEISSRDFEPVTPLAQAKEQFQAQYIDEVLEQNNGNRTKTAKDLEVDPRTIFRHLEKNPSNDPSHDTEDE